VKSKGQQEIVGFVLIVVIVMIAMMVFLIISVRDSGEEISSVGVSNMLDVLMKTTTECAVVYEPDYDDFEDLFKSCYKEDGCSNLDRPACEYLNESFMDVISSVVQSDASILGWSVDFFERDGVGILRWEEGNCTRGVSGAQRSIVSGGDSLVVRMRIC
jgi:hypothetical protein